MIKSWIERRDDDNRKENEINQNSLQEKKISSLQNRNEYEGYQKQLSKVLI